MPFWKKGRSERITWMSTNWKEVEMKRSRLALKKTEWSSGSDLACHRHWPALPHFVKRTDMLVIFIATTALSLMFDGAFAQTTRTGTSASSTIKTIPSSSSTSPNSPCSSTNPTSPCYSANAPRNPCYSALESNEPCSTTTTPNSPTSPAPPPPAPLASLASGRVVTSDQAKAQIEANGYSNVSGLRRDAKGLWRGKAVKDELPVNVVLDQDGHVSAN
jgi:hypothetical protein